MQKEMELNIEEAFARGRLKSAQDVSNYLRAHIDLRPSDSGMLLVNNVLAFTEKLLLEDAELRIKHIQKVRKNLLEKAKRNENDR